MGRGEVGQDAGTGYRAGKARGRDPGSLSTD